MSERIGEWIQTYTGRRFWPFDPRPEEVYLEDIAHSLGNLCRFTGHTGEFYSVGQHSVLVSLQCPNYPLDGLLHDTAEVYLNDWSRPVKKTIRNNFKIFLYDEAEEKILSCVYQKFGLDPMSEEAKKEVKHADRLLLATEARDLLSKPIEEGMDWTKDMEKLPGVISPAYPTVAKIMFLQRFHKLTDNKYGNG